jgi:colanic acid/amylovoran biosynthesis glycosyltransferase
MPQLGPFRAGQGLAAVCEFERRHANHASHATRAIAPKPPTAADAMTMRVGYFVNQYPKVSHTFIRREIEALERAGVQVQRYALRALSTELVDAQDQAELARTRVIVDAGVGTALSSLLLALVRRRGAFFSTLALATRMAGLSLPTLVKQWVCFVEACVLWRWMVQDDIHHVHAHFGTNSASVVMLTSALGGQRYSMTVHGPEEFDMPMALALATKVARANFVVAISSFCRSQLYRWVEPVHWPKIHIVHCALEGAQFEAPAMPMTADKRFVCVGRLSADKGQSLLIRALAQLRDEGLLLHLSLAGDGPMRAELQALIDALGLQSQVSITGWVSNAQVRELLLQSRALVQASFAEGLPVVIMEAFAARRPVIATYLAGIPELVQPGHSGWLTPASDMPALCEALRQAARETPERLAQMGQQGHASALAQHHVDTEAAHLRQLFANAGATQPVAG